MKRRPLKGFDEGSSSSEDENDAFASLSKTNKKRSLTSHSDDGDNLRRQDSTNSKTSQSDGPVAAEGSSAKRHHHISAARKSKLDALLSELQSAQPTDPSVDKGVDYGRIDDEGFYGRPNKMGSFVEPGMEHLTTNIFVGNLDPCTTEEELTDAFRQFGDLYSVKIMWPRTAEERGRNRNTGFVCFMTRKDAEEAMIAYSDADPLETGRRMLLRWGKNVKKNVQFGTGGVPTHFRKKPRVEKRVQGDGMTSAQRSVMEEDASRDGERKVEVDQNITMPTYGQGEASKRILHAKQSGPIYHPVHHAATAIIVNTPSDPRRLRFIATVASFVAKDGSFLEQQLIQRESSNPEFQFLFPNDDGDDERLAEHIFYRWRVYAFAQGDGWNSWRTTPFVMIEPHGRFWIPPRLDIEEAKREEEAEKRREENWMAAQEERRKLEQETDHFHLTGRQSKHAIGKDKRGAIKLNNWEKETFQDLLRNKLCATQDSICEAMAFAFDKSGAAIEISEILKEALLESSYGISVDTRIARLYLLSDILFNSQQPGVRNAFKYRDAIEAMSPEVFESLGKHGDGKAGRMTMNRLKNAVGSVLSAWTNWSVYNTNFLDQLECRFDGREYIAPNYHKNDGQADEDTNDAKVPSLDENAMKGEKAAVSTIPRGAWTTSEPIAAVNDNDDVMDNIDGEALDGEALDDDVGGEELEQAAVSTVPRGQWTSSDVDGEALDDDLDGEELDDVDGEALDEDDVDGEALDDDEV